MTALNIVKFPEQCVKADLDDGYLKLSNTIVQALMIHDLSKHETRVLAVVISKTYGYNKKLDWVSGSQICKKTGLAKSRVSEALNKLLRRRILIKIGRDVGPNPVVTEWQKDPKLLETGTSKVTEKRNSKLRESVTVVTEKRNSKLRESVNTKDNTTKNNSTKDTSTKRAALSEPAHDVIGYLNEKTGKKFKGGKSDIQVITARLAEGFSIDELKTIIDNKSSEWKNDPKNRKYLRPETLFCSKHADSYLNERPVIDGKPCPHAGIIKLFHEILPELPVVVSARWEGSNGCFDLETRWIESETHRSRDFWTAFFKTIRKYPRLIGKSDRGWKPDLPWLLERKNFDRLISDFISDNHWGNGNA